MTKDVAKEKNSKKNGKASKKEVIPSFKPYQDSRKKRITFREFFIMTTVGVTEKRLRSHFKKMETLGYEFSYKGLHMAGNNSDGSKVDKLCYLFTAICLEVPVNFPIKKIEKDIKEMNTRSIIIRFDGAFEDYAK